MVRDAQAHHIRPVVGRDVDVHESSWQVAEMFLRLNRFAVFDAQGYRDAPGTRRMPLDCHHDTAHARSGPADAPTSPNPSHALGPGAVGFAR